MVLAGGAKGIFLNATLTLGLTGVHVFFLLTGYFLIKSEVRLKSLWKIWLTVSFWAILTLVVATLAGIEPLAFGNVISALFPVITNAYWFITTYFVIVLMSVKINQLLCKIQKRQFATFLFPAIILIHGITWVANSVDPNVTLGGINRIAVYFLTYLMGAYLRLHPPKFSTAKIVLFAVVQWLILLPTLSYLVILKATTESNFPFCDVACVLIPNPTFFQYTSWGITLLSAVTLFLLFMRINIKPSKAINALAATILGVYIIHDSPFIRHWIWTVTPSVYDNWYSSQAIYYMTFVIVIIVFFICAILEMLRAKLYDKISDFISLKRKHAKHFAPDC